MSDATELVTEIERITDEIGSLRFRLTDIRQSIVDNRVAVMRLKSNNEHADQVVTELLNLNTDIGDDIIALLTVHEHLTAWRLSVQ